METAAPSRPRFSRRIEIALAALLLLAGVIWLIVWWFSGPSVYSSPVSDPHWFLYPESDSLPEQEKLAFDGNVKLLSLRQTFQLSKDAFYLTDPQAEKSRKAHCHVLFDLPPEAVLKKVGSGWSTTSGTADTVIEVFIPEEGDVPVTTLRLSFQGSGLNEAEPYPTPSPNRVSDRTFSIRTIPHVYALVDGKRIQVDPKDDIDFQVSTEPGDVFVVRIGKDGRINSEPIRIALREAGRIS